MQGGVSSVSNGRASVRALVMTSGMSFVRAVGVWPGLGAYTPLFPLDCGCGIGMLRVRRVLFSTVKTRFESMELP